MLAELVSAELFCAVWVLRKQKQKPDWNAEMIIWAHMDEELL